MKWLVVIFLAIVLTLGAIAVIADTDEARANEVHEIMMPAVFNPKYGMRGSCIWPNIYDKTTQPACWCEPTPDEGPDYIPWGCWPEDSPGG